MSPTEAYKIVAELAICYPTKKMVVEEVRRWESNLRDFDYSDAQQAVKNIENNSKFFPSWAEFREEIVLIQKKRLEKQRFLEIEAQSKDQPEQSEEDKQKIREQIRLIKEITSKYAR
jgi:hypothetical protein